METNNHQLTAKYDVIHDVTDWSLRDRGRIIHHCLLGFHDWTLHPGTPCLVSDECLVNALDLESHLDPFAVVTALPAAVGR